MSNQEIEAFLEAIVRLKAKPVKNIGDTSTYDQFVAMHGAVMAVRTPMSGSGNINFAHGNIGFLPWHRQYLRVFEEALREEVSEVTLPYWDWSDDLGAIRKLFTPAFIGSRYWGIPKPITDGVFQYEVPSSERPQWWPNGFPGFRVHGRLEEGLGAALSRGSVEQEWPPAESMLNELTGLGEQEKTVANRHPLWVFWLIVEQGSNGWPQTHNAGHRFIGGHMGGAFSPNDPIFWLHHANVDRLWDAWQQRRIATGISGSHDETWPAASETSPINNFLAPEGHKVDDVIWPWVGGAAGYTSVAVSDEVNTRLPTFSNRITVRDVLDLSALNVSYQ